MKTIGIVGNPNCGKTTIFNSLTGSRQHIGNWPGVTVEKKEGDLKLEKVGEITIVDLPGIYSLTATSEDEKASLEYILSHEAELYINVIDATSIERNLYLTMLMCELKVPMVIVVTMMDIARQRRLSIDLDHLSKHLGVPVLGVNSTDSKDIAKLRSLLDDAVASPKIPRVPIEFPNELEQEIDILSSASVKTAEHYGVDSRWVAIKAIEGDPLIRHQLERHRDMAPEVIDGVVERCSNVLGDPPDVVLAETRYGVIAGLVKDVVRTVPDKVYLSEKIDKFVINRFLGIPMFLGVMYIVFWVTQVAGGAFVDFFEMAGDTLFVSGVAELLSYFNAPPWLVAVLANGAGSSLQTVATFLPPVGFMFLCLSILEDSGYMARAAFVMDRFMRWIGLPGKSFVPMLVGFGCSVPAIMATRALDSKRDRLLTIFMTPFMSCSAKLPVWVLFGAAFYPENPGLMIFALYMCGIAIGIVTGLIMKHTLFQGTPTHFIMELPPYHMPRPKHILLHAWERLKIFIWRAGKFIVPMVIVLGLLNTIGTDGSIGNEDSEKSVLSVIGRKVTPVFEPIGVEKDNWQASVSIFTGLFAKESVIGTLNGLYGQSDASNSQKAENSAKEVSQYSLIGGLKEAFATIPANLAGICSAIFDPLGFASAAETAKNPEDRESEEIAVAGLRKHFSKGFHQAFAFLLFVLLYVPCIAATGTVFREVGKGYGTVFVCYLTIIGWSVATVYHSVMVSHSSLWFCVGAGLLSAMFASFWAYGKRHKVDML
ncbi:MAG: Fe(2+) transporter permease subunit FeoB [Kiritimatiellae bacterium]|nr:Fe(2+) transporter permease subunit FeoB [Kiritimatiellia bacterium]